ncbi:MAG: NADH-quinone oxidoreductase subunit NuoB [Proteobacteria bacterium]|nr:NADH-quinone oxidoreductase subunit NuoB [Pseudomonadota bacterium]MBU1714799.1 NADH-quinone oxidoreductase subunit NuoB [Pseudomonadota bacterium]
MLRIIRERFRQGYRTAPFPKVEPVLPERFRGLPVIDPKKCPAGCTDCEGSCPFGAITRPNGLPRIDLGRCLFCADCPACPYGAITFGNDYRLATCQRQDLFYDGAEHLLAQKLKKKMLSLFGRSLKLRQVSAGGCNACEADVNVLSTLVFDLGRFGIQFVASPRHADGLLVTGPVTENMRLALLTTYEAVPGPKIVIASGACAISGGPFVDSPEVHNGLESILPIDLYIPGCPPHPYTILDGLLRLLDQRKQTQKR